MRKAWMGVLLCGLLLGGVAQADDLLIASADELIGSSTQPAILQDPSGAWQKIRDVVDTLEPHYEQFYDLQDGEWYNAVSASVYNLRSRDIDLLSVRAGYGVDHKAYGGVKLNLPGITKRYVPETIQGIATAGYLEQLWSVAGKYAAVGAAGGYDFDRSEPIWGFTVGAQVRLDF